MAGERLGYTPSKFIPEDQRLRKEVVKPKKLPRLEGGKEPTLVAGIYIANSIDSKKE
jgi:hypothetical protein